MMTRKYYADRMLPLRPLAATCWLLLGGGLVAGDTVGLATSSKEVDGKILTEEDARNWSAAFSGRFGWDSNPRQIPNGVSLPPGLSDRDSWFTGLTGELGYEWEIDTQSKFNVGYRGEFKFFHDQADYDQAEHKLSLHYENKLSDEWQIAFDAADILTYRDGNELVNKVVLTPSITHVLAPGIGATLGYAYINLQVAPPIPAIADPDADIHQVYLGFSFDLTANLKLSATYTYSWILADGSDADLREHEIEAGLSGTLSSDQTTAVGRFFSKLNLEAVYTRTFDRYQNSNSAALATGRRLEQRDGIDNVQIGATYPLIERPEGVSTGFILAVFAQYEAISLDSNLMATSYDQNIVQMGLRGEF